MKKKTKSDHFFDIMWSSPTAVMIGIILSFSFDYRLGLLIGAYIFLTDYRGEQLRDELNDYHKRLTDLENGKKGKETDNS